MNENLNQYVQNILVSSNWNIVSQTDSSVILGRSKKVSHIMHFILSILTGGLWLIIWILMFVRKSEQRRSISISSDGKISDSK